MKNRVTACIIIFLSAFSLSALADDFDANFATATKPKLPNEIEITCSDHGDTALPPNASLKDIAGYLIDLPEPTFRLKNQGDFFLNTSSHVVKSYRYDQNLNALVGSELWGKGLNYSIIREKNGVFYEEWIVNRGNSEDFLKGFVKSNLKPGTVIYSKSVCRKSPSISDFAAALKKLKCSQEQMANIKQWSGFFRSLKARYSWDHRESRDCPDLDAMRSSWINNLECGSNSESTALPLPADQ